MIRPVFTANETCPTLFGEPYLFCFSFLCVCEVATPLGWGMFTRNVFIVCSKKKGHIIRRDGEVFFELLGASEIISLVVYTL